MNKEQNIKQLPKDWKKVRLGEVIDLQSGVAFKKSEYSKGGVRLFQIANVSFNYTKWDETEFLPESYVDKYPELCLEIGDIVMALNRPLLNDQLKIAEIKKNDTPAILYQRVGRFKFLDGDNKRYVLYFFQSPVFIKWLKEQLQGVNIPFINKSKLLSYDGFPKIPFITQQAIVSKIEELFSELDKGIEQLKTTQQQLKTYRQAVLKSAFEGRLTEAWRSQIREQSIRQIEGSLVRVPAGLHKVPQAGIEPALVAEPEVDYKKNNDLPEGWKIERISDHALVNPKLPNKELINESLEVQFLPMKLVEEVINKIHLTEIKHFKEVQKGSYTPFIDGDVIFAKVTPCMENGKIAVVEKLKNGIGYGSSEFHVIRCDENLLNKYVFYYLVQDKFRNEAESAMTGAVGLRRVPKQFIENYFMPVPQIDEQNQIVQEIESRLSVADKMEECIAQSLQQSEALRQSILKKAFEGRLI